jgi:ribonuclease T2
MTSMLDLMPAPGLIFNEWDKHGTCSGSASGLFRDHPQGAPR